MFEEENKNNEEDQQQILETEENENRQYKSRHRVKVFIISIFVIFIVITFVFMIGYSTIFGIYFDLIVKPVPDPDYTNLIVLFVTFLISCFLYIVSSCFGISAVLKGDSKNLIRVHFGLIAGFIFNNAVLPIASRIIHGIQRCPNFKDIGGDSRLNCFNDSHKLPCPYIPRIKFAAGFVNVLELMCVIVQLCLYVFRDSILGVNPWKKLEKEEEEDKTLQVPYQFDGIIPLFELEVDHSKKSLALSDVDEESSEEEVEPENPLVHRVSIYNTDQVVHQEAPVRTVRIHEHLVQKNHKRRKVSETIPFSPVSVPVIHRTKKTAKASSSKKLQVDTKSLQALKTMGQTPAALGEEFDTNNLLRIPSLHNPKRRTNPSAAKVGGRGLFGNRPPKANNKSGEKTDTLSYSSRKS